MSHSSSATHWTLTDLSRDIDLDSLVIGPMHLGESGSPLVIRKRRLRGGLRDGVDVLDVEWGAWSLTLLPTRGMGVWRAQYGSVPLRWDSPVQGPVHPQWVPLTEPSGLGWLDGFDEFVARCGLASNGAPEFDDRGQLRYPLHGRIANSPAHQVRVEIDPDRQSVTITGVVDESRFHFQKWRLTSEVRLTANRSTFEVIDRVENRAGAMQDFQLLYHNNVGTPFLGPGSRFFAPVRELVPRNAHAASGLARWSEFGAPIAGGAEQVYLMQLLGDAQQQTRVVLANAARTSGMGLRYRLDQLPCFTLWKNEVAYADGYVTGLEPGTNYPNPRSFEQERGRTVCVPPGGSQTIELQYEVYPDRDSLDVAIDAVEQLASGHEAIIHRQPSEQWCAL